MFLAENQKIDSGFFLLEAEQKAKKERNETRQLQLKQKICDEEIIEISTITDDKFVC